VAGALSVGGGMRSQFSLLSSYKYYVRCIICLLIRSISTELVLVRPNLALRIIDIKVIAKIELPD